MTQNPSSVIDDDAYAVRRDIRIAASVDRVWRAITEPELVSAWFAPIVLDGTGAGSAGTITFPGYGAVPIRVESVDEPRSVTYRWSNDDASGRLPDALVEATATEFTFTLEAVDGGTRLTVVETGFDRTSDPAANLAAHASGWVSELDKLVAMLEGAA
ncbi:SRPBCC domain-containing protein [Agromyces sp. SYSU T00194]|uniref:SRPBCC domain-containing protein n=1 Tax=Agromyces chitinivorans TaxID=3158560 RepID=UPI0033963BC6